LPVPMRAVVLFVSVPATISYYTLSLHDALPIWRLLIKIIFANMTNNEMMMNITTDPTIKREDKPALPEISADAASSSVNNNSEKDRKSTRLNSSHVSISYAVFCLKKKKKQHKQQ